MKVLPYTMLCLFCLLVLLAANTFEGQIGGVGVVAQLQDDPVAYAAGVSAIKAIYWTKFAMIMFIIYGAIMAFKKYSESLTTKTEENNNA